MEYISDLDRRFGISQEPYSRTVHELTQAAETGHDVTGLQARVAQFRADGSDDAVIEEIYRTIPLTPPQDWPFFEGSELEAILAQLPAQSPVVVPDGFADRLRGGWYGQIVGNLLGKPVEFGWSRDDLKAYLVAQDAYPLLDYVPISDLELHRLSAGGRHEDIWRPDLHGFVPGAMDYAAVSRGRIHGGVRDDDIDWSILNLALLEECGPGFTPYDLARTWLTRLPVYQTYTAERAAYNNLVREVPLEHAGAFHNPYREWIGALIRADVFGYVNAGNPRAAALLAHRDAYLSHRANGIYGEMWAAALISSAFTAATPIASLEESLRHIPPTSRLAEEIRTVLADYAAGRSWDQAMDALDARYAGMSWIHTLNNAGALTAAIAYGGGDFSATIGLAVLAALDTDSIGATAGSWAGAFCGYDAIPEHWIEPLKGRTRSAVFGFGEVQIEDLVGRTSALRVRAE
ncbi:ADP-ribosylglycohydrolase [Branchiibius hedensis]|uniref:ADP-ribosylglycohydrolase n=1 Tax=Branchiibius hedensis TaxID=672460 RepID=A0A2Y8ZYB3_9MICO|nr:ADP-ribosylglycohydrolase family protein [Branchiibius hedensis]PWJ27458.1 ADP-ribosylglycohydrolase [Branchiibius hedensis]SSA36268.1 ADP-ribosylglycohydrolase [Branchiibius hedensis]